MPHTSFAVVPHLPSWLTAGHGSAATHRDFCPLLPKALNLRQAEIRRGHWLVLSWGLTIGLSIWPWSRHRLSWATGQGKPTATSVIRDSLLGMRGLVAENSECRQCQRVIGALAALPCWELLKRI